MVLVGVIFIVVLSFAQYMTMNRENDNYIDTAKLWKIQLHISTAELCSVCARMYIKERKRRYNTKE